MSAEISNCNITINAVAHRRAIEEVARAFLAHSAAMEETACALKELASALRAPANSKISGFTFNNEGE